MAVDGNYYEIPILRTYEQLGIAEPSNYTALTLTESDVTGCAKTTTSTSGSAPERKTRVRSTDGTRISVYRFLLILSFIAIVCLVAWNVYLTTAINENGSDGHQVQITSTVTEIPPALNQTGQTPRMSPLMCPRGWKPYQSSCYLFISEKLTFIEAMVFCQTKDGHLVYIDTESENRFVKNECRKRTPATRYLIGLTDIEEEGDWVWVGTGTVTNFTDWAKGEPNRGTTENCVVLWEEQDYHWADVLCKTRQSFICEKDVGQSKLLAS